MGIDLHPGRRNLEGEWASEPGAPSPQWAYGGFNRFRTRLAEAEGFDLQAMRGFDGEREWDTVTTALVPLLHHSDCDGEMTPEECAGVWPRLAEIVATWPDDDYDARSGARLVEAMQYCEQEKLTLLFR